MAVAAALTRLLVEKRSIPFLFPCCCSELLSNKKKNEKKSSYFQALGGTLLQHRKSSGGRSSRSQGLRLGETFERQAIFTHDQVEAFVLLTGDANPIHVLPKQNSVEEKEEEKEEEKKEKKKCIVPGMLCSSLFPAIIGSTFPGEQI